jgi:hypothetical protein
MTASYAEPTGQEKDMHAEVGDRVELISCTGEYTKLEPGELGTVSYIDDFGTVFVDFDNGVRLGLVARAGDRFRNLGSPSAAKQCVRAAHGRPPCPGKCDEAVHGRPPCAGK